MIRIDAMSGHRPARGLSAIERHESMLRFRKLYSRLPIVLCVPAVIAMVVVICRTSHLLG